MVDTFGEENFGIFTSGSSGYYFWLPFQLLLLKNIDKSTNNPTGIRISEGIERGKLALAFEELGMKTKADKEWLHASKLAGYVDEQKEFKELISRMVKSDIDQAVQR